MTGLEMIKEYLSAKAAEEEVKERKQSLAKQIKEYFGEGSHKVEDYKVVFKKTEFSRLDTKAMKADHPEIVKQYEKKSVRDYFKVGV